MQTWDKIKHIYNNVKADWRWLALISYIIVSTITLLVHYFKPGNPELLLDGILSTLASIVASLVVTTFSFVFVALQLASVQFSPRIIRSFFDFDDYSKFFLWSFLACAFFLVAIQYFGYSYAAHIFPKFGIIGAFYLIIIVFPLFIHHVVEGINASSITDKITNRTLKEIEALYKFTPTEYDGKLIQIRASKAGYLDMIDYNKLLQLVPENHKSKITFKINIGSFVLKGGTLLEIESPNEEKSYWQQNSHLLSQTFHTSKFRSYTQDVAFGIRQLVDIAIKAISPAVNDPTTALNCIDNIGRVVQQLAQSEDKSKWAKLLEARNIQPKEFDFAHIVDFAFDQIYEWGKSDYIVVRHLIKTIGSVIPFVNNSQKLHVLWNEIHEMELQNLCNSNGNFDKKEHSNSVRRYLISFYQSVIHSPVADEELITMSQMNIFKLQKKLEN